MRGGRNRGVWRVMAGATISSMAVLCAVLLLWKPHATNGDASSPAPGLAVAADAAVRSFFGAESDFLRARERLLEVLEARRDAVAPQTLAVFLDNLRVIDASIVELAAAHAADPGHPRLSRLLAAACQREIELLQRAAEVAEGGAPAHVEEGVGLE